MGIAEARETIRACQYCFMCRYACPTFQATKLESVTPRGYALILGAIDQGDQTWTKESADRFYQCSLCGVCKESCEYHWEEDATVRHARQDIAQTGNEPVVVQQLVTELLDNPAASWGAIDGLPADALGKSQPDVLYLAGYQTLHYTPAVAQANIRILNALPVSWGVLEAETSSGFELYDLGHFDEAKEVAQQLADAISQVKPGLIVTGCTHTYRTLKEHFPAWGIALPDGVEILHTSEFYARMLAEGHLKLSPKSPDGVVSYHDPCQLGRKMEVYDAPRQLIEAIIGVPPAELFHNRAEAECCGAGSVMHLTHNDTARRVAQVRLGRAAEEQTNTLVTACQNCKSIFEQANDRDMHIMDLSELIALHIK